jgi:hypothetical protein
MDEQRIAMQKRRVGLLLVDGSRLEGDVFLNLYDARRMGPQRLGDLLNSEIRFLPVETPAGIQLVNCALIVNAYTDQREEADELTRLGEKYSICVTTLLQEEIAVDLYVNLPKGSRRVKDCLNQQQRFLAVFREREVLYLNTSYILRVRD